MSKAPTLKKIAYPADFSPQHKARVLSSIAEIFIDPQKLVVLADSVRSAE